MGALVCIHEHGWRLAVADDLARAPEVIQAALQLADATRLPFRRSRHAVTFLIRSPSGQQEADLFVKYFDPPIGWERLKSWCRRSRPSRTARITSLLRAAGFSVPPVLLHGVHRESHRGLIVTPRADGDGPVLALRGLDGSIAAKRAVLRALGEEVGRLHLAGFIHGDLTPFNIRIVIDEPPRFGFIDNDRTRRNVVIARGRSRLRNLVQLGRLALPGVTGTDRMRVVRAYEAVLYGRHSRSLERRLAAMLRRRTQRDLSS
jgi:Lipopolysaccharide kinase (Kdo/WaaP) family